MPKPARTRAGLTVPKDARLVARVWDPFVRIFHWTLVASFVLAWLTPHSAESIHHWAGYAAAALILMRLVWGFLGTRYARFSQFVRHPKTILRYLSDIASGHEARYIGHNPAGGVMVLALMAAMAATAISGWLMTTDAFWGEAWVGRIHELSAHGLLVLIVIHIGGVALASVRHRESLIGAMISGKKRAPEPEDIA